MLVIGPRGPHKHKDPTHHDLWHTLILGLGTRMSYPHVYVVFWPLMFAVQGSEVPDSEP